MDNIYDYAMLAFIGFCLFAVLFGGLVALTYSEDHQDAKSR